MAFEVDHYRRISMTGWSVLAKGTSRMVAARADRSELDQGPLMPVRVGSADDRWVRITPRSITGRRLTRRNTQQT